MYADFVGSSTLPPISVDTRPAWYPADVYRFYRDARLRPYYEVLKIAELRSLIPSDDIHRLLYNSCDFDEASTLFKAFTGLRLITCIDYLRDPYTHGLSERFLFSEGWDCPHHLVFVSFSPSPFKFLSDSKHMTGSSILEEIFGSTKEGYQYSFPFVFNRGLIKLTCDIGQFENIEILPKVEIFQKVEKLSNALKSNAFGFTLKDFSLDVNRQVYADIDQLLLGQGGFETFCEAMIGLRRNLSVSVETKDVFLDEFCELVYDSFVKVLDAWLYKLQSARRLEKIESETVVSVAQLLGIQHWKKSDSFSHVVQHAEDVPSLSELFLPSVTLRGFHIKTQDLSLRNYVEEGAFPQEGHMFFFRDNSRHEILMTCVPMRTYKLFEGSERSDYERGKLQPLIRCCNIPVDRTHLIPFGYHGQESDQRLVIMWPSQDNRGTLNDFERDVAKLAQCVTWYVSIEKTSDGAIWSSSVYDTNTGDVLMKHEPLVFHGDVEWAYEGMSPA